MRLLLVALCLILAGCGYFSREPEIANRAPPGISYRAKAGGEQEADMKATRYCQQFGKRAKRDKSRPAENGASIIEYSCG